MKLLEVVKMHSGPIAPNEVDKLNDMTDVQLLDEIRYLRQTVAPNIREKRKVGTKFVKFNRTELIGQIVNVLKPENELDEDINQLLLTSMVDKVDTTTPKAVEGSGPVENIGQVAVLEGPFGEKKVGLIFTSETVQLYHLSRYGFEPDDLTEEAKDWKISKIIEDYDFITKRTGVYMRCSISKTELAE